jgi:hypothetical protein
MYRIYLAALFAGVVGSACGTSTEAMSPDKLQQQYGITGAYAATVPTPEGSMKGTIVPVTLADGRTAQLVIPAKTASQPHTVYVKDAEGLHPVQLQDNVTRDQMVQSQAPAVVGRRPEPAHAHNNGWEKDALIIGGSAGGGALVGALAGGKKGAAIGGAAGGIGGLIYDLAK